MVHRIWDTYPSIQKNLERVRSIMTSELSVMHPDVKNKILSYINASGKYIRAGLVLMFSTDSEGNIPKGKLYLAAYVETLHLATLIHDDIIDEADTRRGLEVLNKSFSNRIAVYAGDYLLAYASRLAAKGAQLLNVNQNDNQFFKTNIIERILVGELAQLMNQYREDMSMKDYLKQIKGKTAFLFALSCQLGAWHHEISRQESQLAFQIGQNIGMAFQISDDLIDYRISKSQSGKPPLQDLKNGIYTAPYLLARQSSKALNHYIKQMTMVNLTIGELEHIHQLLEEEGAFEKTESLIQSYLEKTSKLSLQYNRSLSNDLEAFLKIVMNRDF